MKTLDEVRGSRMSFQMRGEAVVAALELDDLKLVYRVLHQNLKETPELLDCSFLDELQDFLHERAREEGIDGSDHGQWDAFLSGTSRRIV
jgi:hypothetical protein